MDRPTLSDGVVTLRPSRPEDADAITEACQDPEVQRWSLVLPWPYERDDGLEFIARSAEDAAAGRAWHLVAVDDGDRVIGAFSVMGSELGYRLAPAARGRGVATRVDTSERRIPPRGKDPDPHVVYEWRSEA